MRKLITNQKAITLIALVVTIIVLLTLAGVTISSVISDDGVIKKAQEAKFKMEASSYKEIEYNKQLLMTQREVDNIYTLKDILNSEIETLEKGITRSNDTISMIRVAEGGLVSISSISQRIFQLLTNYVQEDYTDEEKETIRTEIEELRKEIDNIAEEVEFDNTKLLNGTYSYLLEFGDKTFEQGSMQVTIENMNWKSLYGDEELDYKNAIETMEKVRKVIENVAKQRSILGSRQKAIESNIDSMNTLKENISNIITDIFGDGTTTITEEQSIEYANSKNTELNFIITAESALVEITDILQRIQELAIQIANNGYIADESEKQSIQDEIDRLIDVIEIRLKHTKVTNKKFLQGYFPYLNEIDIAKMGLDNISIKTEQKAAKALEKIQGALDRISKARAALGTRANEIEKDENYKTAESDLGCAFNIKIRSEQAKINEVINDKFAIINGKLFYTGNDQNEKKWAQDLEIAIKENT